MKSIDQTSLAPPGRISGCRSHASAATADGPHRCELDDGPALALDTARRLACDCTVVGIVEGEDGEPLNIGRKSRNIPTAIARALKARDGGCRYPGCDRTRFTEGHHLEHWAGGGETKLGNLVTLCWFHHTSRTKAATASERPMTDCSFSRGRTGGASSRTA